MEEEVQNCPDPTMEEVLQNCPDSRQVQCCQVQHWHMHEHCQVQLQDVSCWCWRLSHPLESCFNFFECFALFE